MSEFVELRDVWVEYGGKVVLERVSLHLAERSFVAVVGPSGAGKTTLLRLLLGQEAPSRGQVLLDGKPMRAECGPDRGVVFQRYSVFPHLTALRNVMFGLECAQAPVTARLFGAQRRAARETAAEMLAAVGLDQSMDVYPAQMSGGMQQRLAIAQALVKHPRILLLDEPFGALDPHTRLGMHGLVTRLWRERGLTILMVTHDIPEAFKLGTRVLAFDRQRHDAQVSQRAGSTVAADIALAGLTPALRRAAIPAGLLPDDPETATQEPEL
ncbi:ABC transporter ATP-binding protein [Sphingomonas bacterium]|uniref:ABC transporter ATP-binding protein n=1 Tax=Sphingomonas bacterium TaxID=1895847 RepID=UPI0015752261|nr:ABC transporter ATP-binding protein [Sphingomonas bacterium]